VTKAGRWLRCVAAISVAGVAYAWGASGEPAEGAAIGVGAGVLIGSFAYVEGHADAFGGPPLTLLLKVAVGAGIIAGGGVLAAALDLEPNSGARLGLVGVALVLAIVVIALWDAAANRGQAGSE
jgi:hypothetical protein